jgi:DHA3 family macrolide efflux protein-like MFS transporter
MILGFALAGPITLAFGSDAPYWASSILMVLAGFAAIGLPSLLPHNEHPHKNNYFTNLWGEFTDGLKTLANTKSLHFSFTSLSAIQVYNGMIITLAPAFVSKVLGFQLEDGTLYMILPLAIGILLGSLLLGWEGEFLSKKRMVRIGFFGCGIMTILISALVGEGGYWIYCILAFILGIFNTYIFAPSHALLQANTEERVRGRVYASLFLLLQLGATLPTVIVGILADRVGISVILAALGVLLLPLAFVLGVEEKNLPKSA